MRAATTPPVASCSRALVTRPNSPFLPTRLRPSTTSIPVPHPPPPPAFSKAHAPNAAARSRRMASSLDPVHSALAFLRAAPLPGGAQSRRLSPFSVPLAARRVFPIPSPSKTAPPSCKAPLSQIVHPRNDNPLHNASQPIAPPPSRMPRRAFVALTLAMALSTLPAISPPPAKSMELAPTPINPYARRRREKAYQRYAEQIEQSLEKVAVADFEHVVRAGGGGISVSYHIAGFAAFVASAVSTAILHPIDSIKTRLQARAARLTDTHPDLFDNLYRGLFSNVLKEAPNAAIYLAVYELCKSGLTNLSFTTFFHDLPLLTFMVAGALGDAIGSVVRVPAEIVNKRLQLGVSASWVSALRDAFFTPSGRDASAIAWQAVLLRDVPYGGLQIMLYEFGKLVLHNHPHLFNGFLADRGIMADALMGAVAGSLAAMITTPADVLVTRLSVSQPSAKPETGSPGVTATARTIWITEGFAGFFRGALQRGAYYAPLIGLFFALYEFSRQSLADPTALMASFVSFEHVLLADWHALPAQLSHAYQAVVPYLTAFAWLISEQLPLVLSVVTASGGQM